MLSQYVNFSLVEAAVPDSSSSPNSTLGNLGISLSETISHTKPLWERGDLTDELSSDEEGDAHMSLNIPMDRPDNDGDGSQPRF